MNTAIIRVIGNPEQLAEMSRAIQAFLNSVDEADIAPSQSIPRTQAEMDVLTIRRAYYQCQEAQDALARFATAARGAKASI